MKHKPLIILTGPTASGKSGLSIPIAKHYNCEIISADSMQIYRDMNIGTAKITESEMQGVPHHLLSFLDPDERFSVAEYAIMAREKIDDIHSRGKVPLLVGGTGLYIQAIADNIQFFDLEENLELRDSLREFARLEGNEALWERLNSVDTALAGELHPNNLGRVIRGIEVFEATGVPLSQWQIKSRAVPSPYNTVLLGITYRNRETLYERINIRVNQMIAEGLLEETKELVNQGFGATAAQAIGYKEMWGAVDGSVSIADAADSLKQSTRRYAKRQLTWMRGRDDLNWIYREDYSSDAKILEYIFDKIDAYLD